jgi:hypothetical protein
VCINEIEDWCIDYTYPNPTLWIFSASSVWYRIAGALCPGGHRGSPTQAYAPIFRNISDKFVTCAHVVMCLLDLLPTNSKIGLQAVVDEVYERSQGEVDEVTILQNYELIAGNQPELDFWVYPRLTSCLLISRTSCD